MKDYNYAGTELRSCNYLLLVLLLLFAAAAGVGG